MSTPQDQTKEAPTEVLERQETILTETPEQTPSEAIVELALPGVPTDYIEEKVIPTGEQIHQALLTLISLQAETPEGEVSEGNEGDVFLCYDFTLRVKGEAPFRIRGARTLHHLLAPQGLPSATSEMESALFSIMQPIKQHLMGVIGNITSAGTLPITRSPHRIAAK